MAQQLYTAFVVDPSLALSIQVWWDLTPSSGLHRNLNSPAHKSFKNEKTGWAIVAHTFDLSTLEAETGRSLSLIPVLSTDKVPGWSGLHRETLSQKQKKKKKKGIKEPLPNVLQPSAFSVRMLLPSPLTVKGYDLILYVDLLESTC